MNTTCKQQQQMSQIVMNVVIQIVIFHRDIHS